MGEAAHPDGGRFIGKPYGAAELFTEVDDLMRNFWFGPSRSRQFDSRFHFPEARGSWVIFVDLNDFGCFVDRHFAHRSAALGSDPQPRI